MANFVFLTLEVVVASFVDFSLDRVYDSLFLLFFELCAIQVLGSEEFELVDRLNLEILKDLVRKQELVLDKPHLKFIDVQIRNS